MKTQNATLLPLLLLDRRPVATANLNGADTSLNGRVRFFKTPIGTIVSAELHGITPSEGIFDFCIRGNRHGERSLLSPLSEHGDGLICACITRQFAVEDILGKTVEIRETAPKHTQPVQLRAQGQVFSIAEAQ